MYYLYHIKGVKWGCTKDLEIRLKKQRYSISDLDRLITVGNINLASKMEKELNLEYGYKWQDSQDYRFITTKFCSKGCSEKGAKNSGEVTRIPILAYNYKTNQFINEYKSIREASRILNTHHSNIIMVLKGRIKQTGGYTFKYKVVK